MLENVAAVEILIFTVCLLGAGAAGLVALWRRLRDAEHDEPVLLFEVSIPLDEATPGLLDRLAQWGVDVDHQMGEGKQTIDFQVDEFWLDDEDKSPVQVLRFLHSSPQWIVSCQADVAMLDDFTLWLKRMREAVAVVRAY